MRLKDKVAIVTGGGYGIGRAIAERFAQEGADVVVAEINEERGQETVQLVEQADRRGLMVRADVGQPAEVQRMVQETLDAFGRIDILVNNAGILGGFTPFLEVSEKELDEIVRINLKGVFLCGQAVAREMVRAGRGGKIVNLGSIESEIAIAGNSVYASTKGAVRLLTKAMALELAPHKINVNAIGPGPIATGMTAPFLGEKSFGELVEKNVPWGRMGQPQDIAQAALFLASAEADFITGTILFVDGGWLIQ
ncbi:MAG: SDR family oxidoreductase [Candidatus Tectomicrobia bacterium]|uniref:SDR family oxidoreductase n=1 Tax=Tectimicrobiota bacterium TaxID=2528274 RepID=A0A932CLA5_UNCTE|nr:SDR family oxidoreductase [Candidatus Tectomicrobia bacterium]